MTQENIIIDPAVKEMMESAAIGMAAKDFINSGLGQHIVQRASEEVDEALADLAEVDPGNANAIAALQRRINHARGAITWLMEAVSTGDQAMKMLDEIENGY